MGGQDNTHRTRLLATYVDGGQNKMAATDESILLTLVEGINENVRCRSFISISECQWKLSEAQDENSPQSVKSPETQKCGINKENISIRGLASANGKSFKDLLFKF